MQLKFTRYFPTKKEGIGGKPTNFAEKIIKSLDGSKHINPHDFKYLMDWMVVHKKFSFKYYLNLPESYKGKIHTMREDKIGKWNEGDKIDMMMNDGLKEMFRFLPTVPCLGIETCKIEYFMGCGNYPNVYVGGRLLSNKEFEKFIVNDGFDNAEQFCQYFDKDWKGKIIHWTGYKYNPKQTKCDGRCKKIDTACGKCLNEFNEYKKKHKKS